MRKRSAGLYQDDKQAEIRMSHASPAVQLFYEDFAHSPLSDIAHELLHTHYVDRT
nr:iron hydrogenase small subunit [Shewanella marina]